jgi:S1-C subfamily serine protease
VSGGRAAALLLVGVLIGGPGDKVKLRLIRSGKEMTVDVTLGQPPQ